MNKNGDKPCKELGDKWKFLLNKEDRFVNKKILEISLDNNNKVVKKWVDVRPIPKEELWFENVWEDFRNNNIVK